MDSETEKIIKKQMEKLPAEIRNLFTDPELSNKILAIGKKNGIINIEQLGILQTETNLMMLGLVHPDEYPNELKNRLNINEERLNNIIKDVNQQIFKGIREKLKEAYEKTNNTEENIEVNNQNPLESREEVLEAVKNIDLRAQKELPAGNREELKGEPLKNSPRVPLGNSILGQKLSGTFQIPKTETDHSSAYVTKEETKGEKTKLPNIDPYREIPS